MRQVNAIAAITCPSGPEGTRCDVVLLRHSTVGSLPSEAVDMKLAAEESERLNEIEQPMVQRLLLPYAQRQFHRGWTGAEILDLLELSIADGLKETSPSDIHRNSIHPACRSSESLSIPEVDTSSQQGGSITRHTLGEPSPTVPPLTPVRCGTFSCVFSRCLLGHPDSHRIHAWLGTKKIGKAVAIRLRHGHYSPICTSVTVETFLIFFESLRVPSTVSLIGSELYPAARKIATRSFAVRFNRNFIAF
jgi:hypothetical protein